MLREGCRRPRAQGWRHQLLLREVPHRELLVDERLAGLCPVVVAGWDRRGLLAAAICCFDHGGTPPQREVHAGAEPPSSQTDVSNADANNP